MCAGVDFGSLFTGQNMVLASGALKAVGSIVEGNQGGKHLEYQAAQSLADADVERQIGALRAGKVRKAGGVVSAEAMAAQGASGSSVNSGSALAVREYIDRGAESDALMAILEGHGRARSLEATAAGYRAQGSRAIAAGYAGAGGSILSAAAKAKDLKDRNKKWIRPATFGDTYSLDDPAYG